MQSRLWVLWNSLTLSLQCECGLNLELISYVLCQQVARRKRPDCDSATRWWPSTACRASTWSITRQPPCSARPEGTACCASGGRFRAGGCRTLRALRAPPGADRTTNRMRTALLRTWITSIPAFRNQPSSGCPSTLIRTPFRRIRITPIRTATVTFRRFRIMAIRSVGVDRTTRSTLYPSGRNTPIRRKRFTAARGRHWAALPHADPATVPWTRDSSIPHGIQPGWNASSCGLHATATDSDSSSPARNPHLENQP